MIPDWMQVWADCSAMTRYYAIIQADRWWERRYGAWLATQQSEVWDY